MSLFFHFVMDAPTTSAVVEALLIEHCGLNWNESRTTLINDGCDLTQTEWSARSRELHRNWFDFELGIKWSLYLRKDEAGYALGRRTVICATRILLDHAPGDAVLLWNGDTLHLRRANGVVTIQPGVWAADELALFHIPYRLEPIPDYFES